MIYLEPEGYPEPCQRSMMNQFVKIVNSYNYFLKLQLSVPGIYPNKFDVFYAAQKTKSWIEF